MWGRLRPMRTIIRYSRKNASNRVGCVASRRVAGIVEPWHVKPARYVWQNYQIVFELKKITRIFALPSLVPVRFSLSFFVFVKKFFLRSINGEDAKYKCVRNKDCIIARATRTQCQYCRYKKCKEVGMTINGWWCMIQSVLDFFYFVLAFYYCIFPFKTTRIIQL